MFSTWNSHPPGSIARCIRFTPHTFDTPEGRLHYVDEGGGRPVLLVHGTPSWSFEWRGLIAGLRSHARVGAPETAAFPKGRVEAPEAVLEALRDVA